MMGSPESRPRLRPYRYVQRMRDRYGVWRHYLRRPGFKRVALAGLYGSEEFAESYRQAMGGSVAVAPREIGAGVPGSLNSLIASYLKSKRWTGPPPEGLAQNSKRNRGPIMEKLRTGPWGSVMVRDLALKHIRAMIDPQTGHAKKHYLKTLRGLFSYAIEIELIEEDPSTGLKVKLPKSSGYHTWDASEIAQYRAHWPLSSEPRLVMEFALETASRRCEIIHLGRQHVKGGRIKIKRAKGCNGVDIPLSAELKMALDAMPSNEHLTYLVNAKGEPYSPESLGQKFAEWATGAGLLQRCRLHGLRKSRTSQLATKGAAPHLIMAVTGHKSLSEVQRYADEYNRIEAADAAMALLRSPEVKEAGLTLDDLIEIITKMRDQKANAECKTG
jgi:integrase